MRPSRLFWGLFFVLFGALFLLERVFDFDPAFGTVWKFWPLVFVIIGLAVILKGRRAKLILAGVAALATAFFLHGLFSLAWIDAIHAEEDQLDGAEVQEFSEPLSPTIERASLSLDAAAGEFTIDTINDQLLNARVKTNIGRFLLDREGDSASMHFRFKPEGHVHIKRWKPFRAMNVANIRLNPRPVWSLDLNFGAAEVDFDLSPFIVDRVRIETGASSVRMKLGMPATETHCAVEAGASSVTLHVPEEAGCELRFKGGFSSKHLDDFTKLRDHVYRTENYERAAKKIIIDAEAGVSSFTVRRY